MNNDQKKSSKLTFTKATLLNLKVRTGIEAGYNTIPIGCSSHGCGPGTSSFHQGVSGCKIQ